MLSLPTLFLCALYAQQPVTADAKAAARELLDKASQMASAASLEVNVIALMHGGETYGELDEEKGVAMLRQAFGATAGLTGDLKNSLQCEVVKKTATLDTDAAVELLRSMAEPGKVSENGNSAAHRVVELLLEDEEFDRAIEVLNLIPNDAEYPYPASQQVFEKLPADDSRRLIVFGRAIEAYSAKASGAFPELLEKHWKDVPRAMAESGLTAVVNGLQWTENDTRTTETIETEKGTVRLGSKQAIEFFRLIQVVRALDPKRAEELLETYPDLKAALEKFPEGRGSMPSGITTRATQSKDGSSFNSHASGGDDGDSADEIGMSLILSMVGPVSEDPEQMQDMLRRFNTSSKQMAAAMGEKDARKALALAEKIELEAVRAEVLGALASRSKDRNVLDKCLGMLGDLKDPTKRVGGWLAAADAAHTLKDEKTARMALERALADAQRMYVVDTDAKKPNLAPRDVWPSTAAARMSARRGAKILGVKVEELVAGVEETDLALLARIEAARQLLDLPPSISSIQTRF